MGNLAVVFVVVVVVCSIIRLVNRHRVGIVAERGLSIGADLAGLAETPRVRIRAVTIEGPDRVRLILTRETSDTSEATVDEAAPPSPTDLDLVVRLNEGDFGLGLLHEWQRTAAAIAIVIPPASRLVRLRSVNDLQHLTLRCVDGA